MLSSLCFAIVILSSVSSVSDGVASASVETLEEQLYPQAVDDSDAEKGELATTCECVSSPSNTHARFGVMNSPSGPLSFSGAMYTNGSVCPYNKDNSSIKQHIPWFKSTAQSWGKTQALLRAEEAIIDGYDTDLIRLYIVLPDVEFDFTAFASPTADHAAIVQTRMDSIAPLQAWVDEYLEETYSATILSHSWLVNGVDVDLAAYLVPALLEEPFVLDATTDSNEVPVEGTGFYRWSGEDITDATLSHQVAQNGYGYDGEGPLSNPTDNIKFGWMEIATLNCDHVGWNDSALPYPISRIESTNTCDYYDCWETSAVCAASNTHATWVGWMAGGSIQEGQDGTYPGIGTSDQRKRSGVLPEMSMHFYRSDGTFTSFRRGLEDAVARGLDVFNFSIGVNNDCDLDFDADGNFNAYLANATLAGLIVTAWAGNDGPKEEDGYCSVNWPAVRSNVLSVSALANRDLTDDYDDVVRCEGCGRGDKLVTVVDGGTKWLPLVDLIAPGGVTYYFTGQASGAGAYSTPVYLNGECIRGCEWGTSFSAPAVAGLAGQTREWMEDFTYFNDCADHPSCVATNLFVMADFYSGSPTYPHSDFNYTVSADVGYGRAYIRRPTSDYLGNGAWWWDTGWSVIDEDETQLFPFVWGLPQPTSIEGVKIAVAWFDAEYEDIADLRVRLVDTCPSGGGDPEEIETAWTGQTMRKKIQVKADADTHGRCLALEVKGLHVDGNGEKFFYAAYAYSNAEGVH
jgi:hypothetical protein